MRGVGKTVLDRKHDEGGNVLDTEFFHEPAAVGFDALGRKVEHFRDLDARLAFHDELQGLPFTNAQAV
jgi:hypothetical protein